jgi:hypothetical protein
VGETNALASSTGPNPWQAEEGLAKPHIDTP